MIKEAYVSFEVAKLLNEKHFIGECHKCYYQYKEDENRIVLEDIQGDSREIDAPTQAMAMRWLREEHDICIYCYPSSLEEYGKWESGACWIKDNVSVIFNNCSHSLYADTYEEAIESALKYVLENLI